ncbi:YggS family pyridoxal phosphate enzyme [Clostridia bacterium]|nr:YggS family pyridoxal phosphate enzyme [Clostridia bacterium]
MYADSMQIAKNIDIVREKIAHAAIDCGRNPSDITLIAASKNANAEQINAAIKAGVNDIGENRVQQLLEKYDRTLPVKWHFIGRLQTNKVKYIIEKVDLIHSVDNIKLAKEIDKQARRIHKTQNILIQVNFFEEKSKGGIPTEDFYIFLDNLQNLQNIAVLGVMLMAPRNVVTQLLHNCNNFVIDICKHKCNNNSYMEIVSFGMSGDFERAIACGSTAVRIGQDIFG